MTERRFSEQIYQILQQKIKSYKVFQGAPLFYKFFIDTDDQLRPHNIHNPVRGQYAFETDILVKKGTVPLVVIELKYGNITTHDILTYSAKARKHKEIYPYLRYGLVIGGREKIDKRFFIHNAGFDFALAIGNFSRESVKLIKVIKNQLSIAEQVIKMLEGREISNYEISENFS